MSVRGVALDFPEVDLLIDEMSPIKNRLSSSLDNIRTTLPPKRPHRHSCQINAFETRRKSTSSNRRRSSVGSQRRHRTSSAGLTVDKKFMSPQQKAMEVKRRRMVYVVVGTFLFILFSCVLVVIVTLTHQTEMSKRNSTLVYYTFAPHPDVLVETTTSGKHVEAKDGHLEYIIVRKENEELMNSLAQDTTNQDSLQNLTASVPVDLK